MSDASPTITLTLPPDHPLTPLRTDIEAALSDAVGCYSYAGLDELSHARRLVKGKSADFLHDTRLVALIIFCKAMNVMLSIQSETRRSREALQ